MFFLLSLSLSACVLSLDTPLDETARKAWAASLSAKDIWAGGPVALGAATEALGLLNTAVKDKPAVCKAAKQFLTDEAPLSHVAPVISAMASLGCLEAADEVLAAKITAAVENVEQLGSGGDSDKDSEIAITAARAIEIVATLAREGKLGAVKPTSISGIAGALVDQIDSDAGAGAGDSVVICLNALALLAEGAQHGLPLNAEDKDAIEGLVERSGDVLEMADMDAVSPFSSSDGSDMSDMAVSAYILDGFNRLAKAMHSEVDVREEILMAAAETFTRAIGGGSPTEAVAALKGLAVFNQDTIYGRPLLVTLVARDLMSTSKGDDAQVKIRVTDLQGKPVAGCKVVLVSASTAAGQTVLSNQELTSKGDVHVFNFLAAKPDPGLYSLELSITPPDRGNWISVDSVTRNVHVITSASVRTVTMTVKELRDVDGMDARTFTITHPTPLDELVRIDDEQKIIFKFAVKNQLGGRPLNPHQAVIRFHHTKLGGSVYFPAAVDSSSAAQFITQINLAQEGANQFLYQNGTYDVELLIGDPFIDNSFTFKIGTVLMQFTWPCDDDDDECESAIKSYKPLFHREWQSSYKPKSEISHTFAVPDPRPSSIISNAFTMTIVGLLACVLIATLLLGNLRAFPSGVAAVWAIAFQAFLLAILALYLFYWFSINMIQTLAVLLALGIGAAVTGQRTLQSLMADRLSRRM